MKSGHPLILLRYWGSYFKFQRQVEAFVAEFRPLVRRGWRCYLVLEREPEDPAWLRELREMGVMIECMPRPRSNFDWRAVARVFQLCRRLRPSLVICTNMHSNTLLGAWLARVPVRLWCKEAMNSAFEKGLPPTWRNRLVLSVRISSFLATRVVAVSRAVKNELVQLGINTRRIVVRHVPRRLGRTGTSVDRGAVRRSLGLAPQDFVIATVGHAVPVKGWDILVRAFAQVVVAVPHARLVLVGSYTGGHEQPYHTALLSYLASQNIRDKVIFAGHRPDVPAVLASADLFVLPSRSEGCSYALIEALEAGLPSVITRVGAAQEVVQDGVNGLIVERGDEAALAQCLLRLAQNESLRRQFAALAVLPDCIPTLEAYSEQMAEDYEALCAGRTIPESLKIPA